jgi:hypothetical protein
MLLETISNNKGAEYITARFISFLEKEGTDFTNSSLRVWYSGMNRRRMPFSYGSLKCAISSKTEDIFVKGSNLSLSYKEDNNEWEITNDSEE